MPTYQTLERLEIIYCSSCFFMVVRHTDLGAVSSTVMSPINTVVNCMLKAECILPLLAAFLITDHSFKPCF